MRFARSHSPDGQPDKRGAKDQAEQGGEEVGVHGKEHRLSKIAGQACDVLTCKRRGSQIEKVMVCVHVFSFIDQNIFHVLEYFHVVRNYFKLLIDNLLYFVISFYITYNV